MRSGLIAAAVFATAVVATPAFADRTNDNDNKTTHHARDIKERVLHSEKSGHVTHTHAVRTEHNSKRMENKIVHRDRGEVIDNYGHAAQGSVSRSSSASKMTKAPAKLTPGGSEEMVDGNKKGRSASSTNGTQVGWSAGGKSIRSYVHFVNDKGEVNNQIHGSTATAMKIRHVATVLLRTAGIFGKLFNWEGSGPDASEDASP